jgi:hypothetical protein
MNNRIVPGDWVKVVGHLSKIFIEASSPERDDDTVLKHTDLLIDYVIANEKPMGEGRVGVNLNITLNTGDDKLNVWVILELDNE